jgi:hypothetical protein
VPGELFDCIVLEVKGGEGGEVLEVGFVEISNAVVA